ncbi:MAG: DNA methyltransferase [Bacilli bacterium]|nr:DNA methyltransferase [Bacilli bacterium]
MSTKQLVWSTEIKNVSELKTWKDNPRKITKEGLEKLKERIKQRGFHSVIVIDKDNTILSGNQRKTALTQLEIKEVNVLVPNRKLTEDERIKIGLESNHNDGEWDLGALKSFSLDLLTDVGFDKMKLVEFWHKDDEVHNDNFDVTKELKKIKEPKTKLGDIIFLGNHKIICGDSTKPENLKRLLGDEKVSMIYSDPVYNLNINYDGGIGGNQDYGGNVNDTRTFEEYKTFIRESLESALTVSNPSTHVFYYCDQIYIGLIQDIYRSLGISNKRVCLWLKNSQNPVPKIFCNKAYEPAVYGIRGRPYLAESITNLNEVLNKEFGTGNELVAQVDDFLEIWTAKRLSAKDYEHATSKPITLHEKAIKRCTKPNDIILDSFLGSGSTLLAGQQLGRKVYGCELEPRFCDLIIKRFELFTGIKAVIKHHEKE